MKLSEAIRKFGNDPVKVACAAGISLGAARRALVRDMLRTEAAERVAAGVVRSGQLRYVMPWPQNCLDAVACPFCHRPYAAPPEPATDVDPDPVVPELPEPEPDVPAAAADEPPVAPRPSPEPEPVPTPVAAEESAPVLPPAEPQQTSPEPNWMTFKSLKRHAPLDPAEERRLIDEAVAAGRVYHCRCGEVSDPPPKRKGRKPTIASRQAWSMQNRKRITGDA